MKTSEQIQDIATALSKMQGTLLNAKEDKKNPFFNSNYADLASIWTVVRKPLTLHGLSVSQDVISTPEGVSVFTRVMHSSGQWIETGPVTIHLDKKGAHAVGSSTTYAKRYSLSAALGVSVGGEDDDGNTADEDAPKPEAPAKVLPKLSGQQVDQWVDKMVLKEGYDRNDVEEYIKARAKYYGKQISEVTAELAKEESVFKKEFEIWLKRKKETPENGDS